MENLNSQESVELTGTNNTPSKKKVYKAPDLIDHGSLVQLIQSQPTTGNDGCGCCAGCGNS